MDLGPYHPPRRHWSTFRRVGLDLSRHRLDASFWGLPSYSGRRYERLRYGVETY